MPEIEEKKSFNFVLCSSWNDISFSSDLSAKQSQMTVVGGIQTRIYMWVSYLREKRNESAIWGGKEEVGE